MRNIGEKSAPRGVCCIFDSVDVYRKEQFVIFVYLFDGGDTRDPKKGEPC